MIRQALLRRGILSTGRSTGQGAQAGSAYLVLSLSISGVMTYVFLGMTARSLSLAEYGMIATLWSTTLLFAPVLWTGITQTLGRYVAEREARGEDWQPVVSSARRLEVLLLATFLAVIVILGPLLTDRIFGGQIILTVAFVAAMVCQAMNYFRRGLLSGHRQFSRLGGTFVVESVSRVCITAVLLIVGFDLLGPATGIALAPLFSVLLIRVASVTKPQKAGAPFNIGGSLRFALPVLVSMACAQAIANGGALLVTSLNGEDGYARAGLLVAALALVRAPQSLLSPAISSLLPHLSRIAALNDHEQMRAFIWKAVAVVSLVGLTLVGGTWLLGEFFMTLVYGAKFVMSRDLLVVLATAAALYLLGELLNQVLFAKGFAWTAAFSWMLGITATVGVTVLLQTEILVRVAYALASGTMLTVVVQTMLLLWWKGRVIHDNRAS